MPSVSRPLGLATAVAILLPTLLPACGRSIGSGLDGSGGDETVEPGQAGRSGDGQQPGEAGAPNALGGKASTGGVDGIGGEANISGMGAIGGVDGIGGSASGGDAGAPDGGAAIGGAGADVCIPNELTCVNDIATRCQGDGSGPLPGGKDCSAQGLHCRAGRCVAPVCVPGQKQCAHGDVYRCVANGSTTAIFTDCAADELCDPSVVACRKRICEPGALGCNGTAIETCNALGTSWVATAKDCSQSQQICVAGACKKQSCAPSTTFCLDRDVYQCDALGLAATIFDACVESNRHCKSASAGNAYCNPNVCAPGTPACNGNIATHCNLDGSGLEPIGTDCGPDSVCDAEGSGSCKPKICTPGSYFCKDDDLAYCVDGLKQYTSQLCADDAPCITLETGPGCVPFKCQPGYPACLSNWVGVCADNGRSLSSVTQDCTATGQVCAGESECALIVSDFPGKSDELVLFGTDQVFGGVFDVYSDRRLTQLAAHLVLTGTRTLHWLVYEHLDGRFELRFEAVSDAQAGSRFFGSGPITYVLETDKRYLLAVAVTGGGSVAAYYGTTPYFYDVSFGRTVGSASGGFDTALNGSVDTTAFYDLRVTTQLP